MLGDNIKALRKQKGYSQETMANQLNVVRQTISKWEKGQSVPDAYMLEQIAELLEVPVSTLLGDTIPEETSLSRDDEIVTQLAILNAQLANQARSRRRTIKIAVISIIAIFISMIVLYFGALILFGAVTRTDAEELKKVEFHGTLYGEEYYYEAEYDSNYQIFTAGGDGWIADHVQTEKYDDAKVMMAQIEDYFRDRGGEYEIIWEEDLQTD